MKKSLLVLVLLCAGAGEVFAEKVLFIHGMSLIKSNADCQDQPECPGYWENLPVDDPVMVGYDGRRNPFTTISTAGSVRLLQMLNKYCRADMGQSCRIVADSMGSYTTAGTLAMYNSTGLYNVLYSTQIVSAEGGSEIANLGETAIDILKFVFGVNDGSLVDDFIGNYDAIDGLNTSYARSIFDHNRNNGTVFYQVPARKSIFIAEPFLPGEDDTLVAFHSSCAYRTTGAFDQCMGQKIRSCSWCFWQRKKEVTPFDGRVMHPALDKYGVNETHAGVHNNPVFQRLD